MPAGYFQTSSTNNSQNNKLNVRYESCLAHVHVQGDSNYWTEVRKHPGCDMIAHQASTSNQAPTTARRIWPIQNQMRSHVAPKLLNWDQEVPRMPFGCLTVIIRYSNIGYVCSKSKVNGYGSKKNCENLWKQTNFLPEMPKEHIGYPLAASRTTNWRWDESCLLAYSMRGDGPREGPLTNTVPGRTRSTQKRNQIFSLAPHTTTTQNKWWIDSSTDKPSWPNKTILPPQKLLYIIYRIV